VRILVTNDDGIESEGIHVLAAALATTDHEIVVVAPDRNWSGAGAALGDFDPTRPLAVQRVEIPGAPGIEAWALDGPPALTVVAGRLGAFGAPPEFIVSGINAGVNTGRTVLHSGTVGAVLAGQNFGLSGLAVSVATTDPWQWESAAAITLEVLELVIAAPARSAVNLNVPGLPRSEILGVKWARLAPFGAMRAAITATTDTHVEFVLEPSGYQPGPETDQGCIDRGYASLTTLAGVVEAWPDDEAPPESTPTDFTMRLVPGADVHPVHVVPDATVHRLLRRPELGV